VGAVQVCGPFPSAPGLLGEASARPTASVRTITTARSVWRGARTQNNGAFRASGGTHQWARIGMRVIEDHRAAGSPYNADAPGDLRCIVAIESIKIVARLLLYATATNILGIKALHHSLDGLYEGMSGTRASSDICSPLAGGLLSLRVRVAGYTRDRNELQDHARGVSPNE
jgi:hypothetical protein